MQLTYYEFAKEELEQLGAGVCGGTSSFTSSSSDTLDSSQPTTGQTTPEDREKHLQDAEEDYPHQQQHERVEGTREGEHTPSGARHYSVQDDSQHALGGEETSGARQYRYCLSTGDLTSAFVVLLVLLC